MKKVQAKNQLHEAIGRLNRNGRISPIDCPTFDEETANYVRERLELYLKSWVLPNLDEVLNELVFLQKELYPGVENNTLDFIRENIKFWKSYDGHKLPEKQVKRAYYNGTMTQNI